MPLLICTPHLLALQRHQGRLWKSSFIPASAENQLTHKKESAPTIWTVCDDGIKDIRAIQQ